MENPQAGGASPAMKMNENEKVEATSGRLLVSQKRPEVASTFSNFRVLLCASLWFLSPVATRASDLDAPLWHGAVFTLGGEIGWDKEASPEVVQSCIEKMAAIKRDGFLMAVPWFKVPGSPLTEPLFGWADTNDLPLMPIIHQGWEAKVIYDQYARDPAGWLERNTGYARKWAEAFKGHQSVKGVILGNEVTPYFGTGIFLSRWPRARKADKIKEEQKYLADEEGGTEGTKEEAKDSPVARNIRRELSERYGGKIEELNKVWGTQFAGFSKVDLTPAPNSPGWHDLRLTSPFWRNIVLKELAEKYGDDIQALNRNWGTKYAAFTDVDIPPTGSGGWLDLRNICRKHFAIILDTLIRDGFKPVLGDNIYYNAKHSRPDPFTWRACKEITCAGWDDDGIRSPLWILKASCDTTRLPVFNSEAHLYSDRDNYRGSPALTRYHYLTSALLGEYWTGSFLFGRWQKKPEVIASHKEMAATLRDLERTQKYFRAMAKAYQNADLTVLLTEENWFSYKQDENSSPDFDPARLDTYQIQRHMAPLKTGFKDDPPFAEVYARMGMTGKPWRYYMENDLPELKKGTMVVSSPLLKDETARALAGLPEDVRLVFVDAIPSLNPYHHPLPEETIAQLARRGKVVKMAELEKAFEPSPIMRPEYQKLYMLPGWKLNRPNGVLPCQFPYARLEVRSAQTPEGHLAVILNNSEETVSAPLPWSNGNYRATDLITGQMLSPEDAGKEHEFTPFAVRIFRLEPASS